jgi:hypothetical protein
VIPSKYSESKNYDDELFTTDASGVPNDVPGILDAASQKTSTRPPR